MKDYSIEKKIGEGNFSEVFLIENKKKEKFVYKKFKTEFLSEARREYLYQSVFKDDSIAKVLEYTSEPAPGIIVEYIEGKTINPLNLSKKEKHNLIAQIAQTLSLIHSAGIVLNDLKPENIILRNSKPVIIDFGLATLNFYNDHFFRGTISYSAPEKILRYTNHVQADIFSLGILTSYILNNNIPANNKTSEDYLKLIKKEKNWNNYLKNEVESDFVKKMLAFNPLNRPKIHEIIEYFSIETEKSLDLNHRKIDQIVFNCQLKAVEILWKKKKLLLDKMDEPIEIISLAKLYFESKGYRLVELNEENFILNPDYFYSEISKIMDSKIKNPKQLFRILDQEKSIKLLIITSSTVTKVFEQLKKLNKSYIVEYSAESQLDPVKKNEIHDLLQNINKNQSDIEKDLSNFKPVKPLTARIFISQLIAPKIKSQNERTNNLANFLAFVNLAIPIDIITELFSNWQQEIHDTLISKTIKFSGNSLIYNKSRNNKMKIETELIENAIKIFSSKHNYFLAGCLLLRLNKIDQAFEYWEDHIRHLRKSGYHLSAYSFFQWFRNNNPELILPFNLLKREASLARFCGYPDKAIMIYKKLLQHAKENEKAVLEVDLAIALQNTDQNEEALVKYESAIQYLSKSNQRSALIRTKNNYATLLYNLSRFRESEKIFREILDLAETENDELLINIINFNLADIYSILGDWKRSLHFSHVSYDIAKKTDNFYLETSSELLGLFCNFALGNTDNFLQLFEKMFENKKLKENQQLYSDFLQNFLFIAHTMSSETAKQIIPECYQNKKLLSNKKLLIEVIFFYFHHSHYNKCFNLIQDLPENDEKKLILAILDNDLDNIILYLRKLASSSNVKSYTYYLYHLLQKDYFLQSQKLNMEIDNFLKFQDFVPLVNLIQNRDISQKEKHFPVFWEILDMIHKKVDFNDTIEAVLAALIKICNLERAIYFVNRSEKLDPTLGLDRSFNRIDTKNIKISHTILESTIKYGNIKFFTNLQDDTSFDIHSSIFGLGLRTAVCYPLIINHEVKGVIYSDAQGNKAFSEDEKKLSEAIFIQAKSALEKSIIYEKMKERQAELMSTISNVSFDKIIGKSKPMQEIFTLMRMVGKHNVNVLIIGPTGSGKELIAKALHQEYSPENPMVSLNCAAIPAELLESELFGYVKGAFTGAVSDKKGKIELADKGTLFLDEIADMPLDLQAKLLRVIQERVFTPVGSNKEKKANFRIIAATNKNLHELVEEKIFREDLLFRLKVIELKIPSLNERIDDLPLLLYYFLDKFNEKFSKQIKGITPEALNYLQNRNWQGNVRQLENEIERAVLLCQTELLNMSLFTNLTETRENNTFESIPEQWEEFKLYKKKLNNKIDNEYVNQLLEKTSNNINQASKLGKINRRQLYRILKHGSES